MPQVLVALFNTETDAREALESLEYIGVADANVSCLAAGPSMSTPGARALVAVKVDPSRAERELVEKILLDHDGRFVPRWEGLPEVMMLIQHLPGAHDSFKSPEAVLPPVLLLGMQEERAEQPELEPRGSRLPFGYRITGS